MIADCGTVPISLELDFDTFEGPWQYIHRFRGRRGWLLMADATIQSEDDLLTTRLIAACDECEQPIPGFQAIHLAECEWVRMGECAELYPSVLDDVLVEEEGLLRARWLRERNAALAEAFEAQQQTVADLEGRARSRVRRLERIAARLRHRRRHPNTGPELRMQLGLEIAALEEEIEEVMDELARDRAEVRRSYEAQEDALWAREDVLVEVEITHCIQWSGARALRHAPIYQPISAPLRRRKKGTRDYTGDVQFRLRKTKEASKVGRRNAATGRQELTHVVSDPGPAVSGTATQDRSNHWPQWRTFSVPHAASEPEPAPCFDDERAEAVATVRKLQELLRTLQPATSRHDHVSLLHKKAVLELARRDASAMRSSTPAKKQAELAEQIADFDRRIAALDRITKAER